MSDILAPPPDQLDLAKVKERDIQRVLATQLLQDVRWQAQAFTEFIGRLQGRLTNDVLQVELLTIPAEGYVTRSWRAPAGAVAVDALGANPVTVAPGGGSADPPTSGVGVHLVPAGQLRVIAIAAREVTLWGTPGDQVQYQAFTAAAHLSVTNLAGPVPA
ncbi:MAG TPA: hypothetical protein VHA75_21275 [Rugosimonospora sp.]|nr:hypothetical protein [Rugosimonospora sp.]